MSGRDERLLDVFIGRWINQGETIEDDGRPPVPILTSDVYEWGPGGRFVVHSAYGRIGDTDVGGLEIIRWDAESGRFRTHFFDSEGGLTCEELELRDGVWTWTGAATRVTATFSDDGTTQVADHERFDDAEGWVPSMSVTLHKVR